MNLWAIIGLMSSAVIIIGDASVDNNTTGTMGLQESLYSIMSSGGIFFTSLVAAVNDRWMVSPYDQALVTNDGSSEQGCSYIVHRTYGQSTWYFYVAFTTAGPDGETQMVDEINGKLQECVDLAEYHDVVGYCCRIESGQWQADIRTCLAGVPDCGWKMPC